MDKLMAEKKWYLVDATDKPIGRLAVRISQVLQGKHKPTFTPHQDVGDFVIVTNVEKIRATGNKTKQKTYYRHSQYPGGLKKVTLEEMQEKFPERVITLAVKGMLPRNKLREPRLNKLKVYVGATHPHQAQNPEPLPEQLKV